MNSNTILFAVILAFALAAMTYLNGFVHMMTTVHF